jgi:hypothetical protein
VQQSRLLFNLPNDATPVFMTIAIASGIISIPKIQFRLNSHSFVSICQCQGCAIMNDGISISLTQSRKILFIKLFTKSHEENT